MLLVCDGAAVGLVAEVVRTQDVTLRNRECVSVCVYAF